MLVDTVVESFDPEARLVSAGSLEAGEQELAYGQLVIASGAEPVRPPIPGLELAGVHVLHAVKRSGRRGERRGWPGPVPGRAGHAGRQGLQSRRGPHRAQPTRGGGCRLPCAQHLDDRVGPQALIPGRRSTADQAHGRPPERATPGRSDRGTSHWADRQADRHLRNGDPLRTPDRPAPRPRSQLHAALLQPHGTPSRWSLRSGHPVERRQRPGVADTYPIRNGC